MKVSKTCLTLVQKWEGFYTSAYLCPAGVWTIGYGTTKWPNGKSVKKGDTITKTEASALLEKQVNEHASTIASYIKAPLNQNQYDALASFQYNLGRHILKGSSLLKYLNAQQWDKACNSMMQYCKARNPKTGKLEILRGLENRRKEEVTLFKKAVVALASVKTEIEVDELVFTSDTLKEQFETRTTSPATSQLLDAAAVKHLGNKSKLKDGKLLPGDMASIGIELAVHFAKLNK